MLSRLCNLNPSLQQPRHDRRRERAQPGQRPPQPTERPSQRRLPSRRPGRSGRRKLRRPPRGRRRRKRRHPGSGASTRRWGISIRFGQISLLSHQLVRCYKGPVTARVVSSVFLPQTFVLWSAGGLVQEPAVRLQLHLQHDCLSSRDLQKLAVGMQVVFVPKDDTKRKREETAAATPAEVTPTSAACHLAEAAPKYAGLCVAPTHPELGYTQPDWNHLLEPTSCRCVPGSSCARPAGLRSCSGAPNSVCDCISSCS